MSEPALIQAEGAAPGVAERFAAHVAERNRRSAKAAVWLTAGLNLGFVALDRLLTDDPRRLAILLADRAAIAVAVVSLALAVRRPWFTRHTAAITGLYMATIDIALAVMTTQLGGFSSGYYAGINLVTLAAGLLFLWPVRVAALTHAAAVAAYALVNLPGWEPGQLRDAVMHGFFLTSTAVIASVGQLLAWRQAQQQLETQAAVEHTKERLEAAHGELQRLDQFKSAFFANITHELKTPLAMVLSPLELLYQGDLGPLGETQKATIRSMLRSGFKLLALIDDLLDLARAEQAGIRLRIAERDLREHLGALVQQIGVLARRKDVELTATWPEEPCLVWCDIDRLERVWINLLSNALKFTPPGGHVWVELRREGDGARVVVRDDGPGFPPELAGKLFDRFFQVDMAGTRRFGGAGIGLALARHIVELHGGTIAAQGQVDQGAEFSVYLPADRSHFGDIAVEATPASEGERTPSQGDLTRVAVELGAHADYRLLSVAEATERRVVERDDDENERQWTVLIVEDTPDVIRIVHLALRQHFKVLAAPDGLKGLELALRERPSLIITDLMMPGIDGFELVRRVRAHATTRHIPVIMLTARGAVEEKVQGLEAGVNAYLTKPFSPRELLSTARALLDGQETQAELLLTRQMDSLETLTGGLAHEINNPLNYIRNAVARLQLDVDEVVQLAQPGAVGDPAKLSALAQRTRKMADTAEAGVRRIQATVELMGRYSREGYSRVEREHDVWQAVADVVGVVRPAVGRAVDVTMDLPGTAVIRCVPEELHQALANLIQNAIEAAPEIDGKVEIIGTSDLRHVTLRVCDNGPGIPEADRQRIFQPFFSTKGPGRGMGMGLTITRQVVAALGGQIRVEPMPGGGTCFELRLPRQRQRISQPL